MFSVFIIPDEKKTLQQESARLVNPMGECYNINQIGKSGEGVYGSTISGPDSNYSI